MSGRTPCICKGTRADRMKNWVVITYRSRCSAFDGYQWRSSDYSFVRCFGEACLGAWRTKSDYVSDLRILNNDERKEYARTGQLPTQHAAQ